MECNVCAAQYQNAHVLVEAYPSAFRADSVAQSDDADALCTADALQLADIQHRLAALLNLSGLPSELHATVSFEGWIVGQQI